MDTMDELQAQTPNAEQIEKEMTMTFATFVEKLHYSNVTDLFTGKQMDKKYQMEARTDQIMMRDNFLLLTDNSSLRIHLVLTNERLVLCQQRSPDGYDLLYPGLSVNDIRIQPTLLDRELIGEYTLALTIVNKSLTLRAESRDVRNRWIAMPLDTTAKNAPLFPIPLKCLAQPDSYPVEAFIKQQQSKNGAPSPLPNKDVPVISVSSHDEQKRLPRVSSIRAPLPNPDFRPQHQQALPSRSSSIHQQRPVPPPRSPSSHAAHLQHRPLPPRGQLQRQASYQPAATTSAYPQTSPLQPHPQMRPMARHHSLQRPPTAGPRPGQYPTPPKQPQPHLLHQQHHRPLPHQPASVHQRPRPSIPHQQHPHPQHRPGQPPLHHPFQHQPQPPQQPLARQASLASSSPSLAHRPLPGTPRPPPHPRPAQPSSPQRPPPPQPAQPIPPAKPAPQTNSPVPENARPMPPTPPPQPQQYTNNQTLSPNTHPKANHQLPPVPGYRDSYVAYMHLLPEDLASPPRSPNPYSQQVHGNQQQQIRQVLFHNDKCEVFRWKDNSWYAVDGQCVLEIRQTHTNRSCIAIRVQSSGDLYLNAWILPHTMVRLASATDVSLGVSMGPRRENYLIHFQAQENAHQLEQILQQEHQAAVVASRQPDNQQIGEPPTTPMDNKDDRNMVTSPTPPTPQPQHQQPSVSSQPAQQGPHRQPTLVMARTTSLMNVASEPKPIPQTLQKVMQCKCKLFMQSEHSHWSSFGSVLLIVSLQIPSQRMHLQIESDKKRGFSKIMGPVGNVSSASLSVPSSPRSHHTSSTLSSTSTPSLTTQSTASSSSSASLSPTGPDPTTPNTLISATVYSNNVERIGQKRISFLLVNESGVRTSSVVYMVQFREEQTSNTLYDYLKVKNANNGW
ncbi:hypothetical protein DM01DRAFT_1131695 [Hesseltinella vesiculosa]|uniref:Uncharacterized protein n=1 Tax=Hesseltinella vesiculosa TaxID=101127 RepID=A0A1X2G977_9FUNG|nr:hypothetical protein DM01DRAFT_1131695 [Hesseltinella vesiculosa]